MQTHTKHLKIYTLTALVRFPEICLVLSHINLAAWFSRLKYQHSHRKPGAAHTHTKLKLGVWQKPKGTQVALIQDKYNSTAVHSEGNYTANWKETTRSKHTRAYYTYSYIQYIHKFKLGYSKGGLVQRQQRNMMSWDFWQREPLKAELFHLWLTLVAACDFERQYQLKSEVVQNCWQITDDVSDFPSQFIRHLNEGTFIIT